MNAAAEIRNKKDLPWNDEIQIFVGRLLRQTKEKWVHAFDIARVWEILLDKDKEEEINAKFLAFKEKIQQVGFDGRFGKTAWSMTPIFSVCKIYYKIFLFIDVLFQKG